MSKYDDLVKKLKEIFQIDKPELDFGIYRILNSRVVEINDYLENRLKAKVVESLEVAGSSNTDMLQKELKEKEAQYREDGIDPDTVPKVRELREKLSGYGTSKSEHENAVFTHLLTFFSRYYDKGDFISQRRYKGDTYAIPYSGEEVVLHWANKDQYYTKSGENFSNYAFKLDDGRTVRFRLITADTAKDNRKDNDKDRCFVLIEPQTQIITDDEGDEYEETFLPVEEVNGELVLKFEYKAMPKGSKQDALVQDAVKRILADPIVKERWLDLSKREPTEKNPHRTLLEKSLASYTSKNTADYFIHKDLGRFLRGELDFYIKNEVMHLDDIQNVEKFADIEKKLRMIQTLRSIALDLIIFLAQLEDFQKKLWLKKKFVVAAHYCITLDRVPESLYPEIAANPQQWEQWDKLGMLTADTDLFKQAKTGSIEYLKQYPYLMVDTALFGTGFKHSLLATVDNLDESLDGLLIHGDNFQALNLLKERYRCKVKGIYIDPPYNTDASPIVYKNGYQHSSWASLFSDRMAIAMRLLQTDSIVCVAIDDFEYPQQFALMSGELGFNHAGTAAVRSKPQGRPTKSGFSANHEYAVFWSQIEKPFIGRLPRKGSKAERYPYSDDRGIYSWANFRKSGTDSDRTDRKKSFYPVYIHGTDFRVPEIKWNNGKEIWDILEPPALGEVVVWPIDQDGNEKVWTCSARRLRDEIIDIKVISSENGCIEIQKKYRPNQDGALPGTWWESSEYSASESGTKVLKDLFKAKDFDFPKSINLVVDNLRVMNINSDAIVIDYFGGSGTTACATIVLNREDKGSRKYILVEQGDYFDTVLKPRIQKVVYSSDWKNGKPTTPQTGISHAFKVLKIESYEDTLNNLELRRTEAQKTLFDNLPKSAKEDYLLRYMLDIESRGSLLSVDHFRKPFDFRLKVTVDSAGAYEERTIDLVETFNYLIGLRVKHIDMQPDKGFGTVTGCLPTGEKTLVIWRDTELVDYEKLDRLCTKLAINPADSEFEIVYINGDHNIPTVSTSLEAEGGITRTMKIRQIEPEFLSLMFAEDDII